MIPLDADDVVHQSFGDRLLHSRHPELALGVLGVKDHRSPADAYNFRGIQSALSASCPLQAGPLALSQEWAKRRDRHPPYVTQLRMQVDRNEVQLMEVLLDSGIERLTGIASGERERCNLSLAIMDRNSDAMSNPELAGLFHKPLLLVC